MARTAMAWLIAELRRKVFDYKSEDLDDGVKYAGDTIRLSRQFMDLAGATAAVSVTNATAKIWSPGGVVKVSAGSPTASTATGMVYYDFISSTGMSQGAWRIQFAGSVGSSTRRYTQDFEMRKTQRIWSDDELQIYLDRHSSYAGNPERELLTSNPGFTKYFSKFGNFESVTLYDGPGSTASSVTADTEDLVRGMFTFNSAQGSDLYLEGSAYSILLAAAEGLEELAGDPSRASSWTRGGVSQKSQDPLLLAKYYRYMESGMVTVQANRTY